MYPMNPSLMKEIERVAPGRGTALWGSPGGLLGLVFLGLVVLACVGTLPWTLGNAPPTADALGTVPRYNEGELRMWGLPPWWWPAHGDDTARLNSLVEPETVERVAAARGMTPEQAAATTQGPVARELSREWPTSRHKLWFLLGSDVPG